MIPCINMLGFLVKRFDNMMVELLSRNTLVICLVFLWNTWFFDNMMAELLSQKTVVGSCFYCNKYFNILLIQIAWQNVLVVVMYSASAEERVTMGCFLDAHDTIPVPKWNVYPKVLFLSSMLPPQSLSVYPMSVKYYEME